MVQLNLAYKDRSGADMVLRLTYVPTYSCLKHPVDLIKPFLKYFPLYRSFPFITNYPGAAVLLTNSDIFPKVIGNLTFAEINSNHHSISIHKIAN